MAINPGNNVVNENRQNSLIYQILKTLIILWLINAVIKSVFHSKKDENSGINKTSTKEYLQSAWKPDQKFDFDFYILNEGIDHPKLLATLKNNSLSELTSENQIQLSFPLSQYLSEPINSLKVKITFYRSGLSSDKNAFNFDIYSFSQTYEMVKFFSEKSFSENQGKNLIYGEESMTTDKMHINGNKEEKNAALYPNLNLKFLTDFRKFEKSKIPEELKEYIKTHFKYGTFYFPIVYRDDFWTLKDDFIKINQTGNEYELQLEIGTISMTKFILKSNMDKSLQINSKLFGEMQGEFDNMKRILKESNPYFLGLTTIVSLLHMVFETLAFKNDIYFWKEKTDLHGLSVRTIIFELFSSIIVFLYLVENETSWMITVSSFFYIFVNLWKLTKAFSIKVRIHGGIWNMTNWLQITPKCSEQQADSTDEYDQTAIKYLCWTLLPLITAYSVYSLLYEEHKGWYQWILNSLVGSVYTFGFIMMCPQLYINYKLKSVAHLPWRMMTYKALNTVIDDLFAFVIKMPTLHRISCFRDDVVFAIFLYQWWKYGIDYTRTNEFGYTPVDKRKPSDTLNKKDEKEIKNVSSESEKVKNE